MNPFSLHQAVSAYSKGLFTKTIPKWAWFRVHFSQIAWFSWIYWKCIYSEWLLNYKKKGDNKR